MSTTYDTGTSSSTDISIYVNNVLTNSANLFTILNAEIKLYDADYSGTAMCSGYSFGSGGSFHGTSQADSLFVWGSNNVVSGQEGNDTITVLGSNNLIGGGAGNNTLSANGIDPWHLASGNVFLIGADGSDTIKTSYNTNDQAIFANYTSSNATFLHINNDLEVLCVTATSATCVTFTNWFMSQMQSGGIGGHQVNSFVFQDKTLSDVQVVGASIDLTALLSITKPLP